MVLALLRLTLHSDAPMHGDATKLRDFFATSFNEHALPHRHVTDKLICEYPRQIGYPNQQLIDNLCKMIKTGELQEEP